MKSLLMIFFLMLSQFVQADYVQYDRTFDDDGYNAFDFSMAPGSVETPFIVASGPNNRYYIAGEIYQQDPEDGFLLVARFKEDGSLDTNFGQNGASIVSFDLTATGRDYGRHLHILDNGNMYLSGFAETDQGALFGVARLLEDGSLDDSFGSEGKTTINFTDDPAEEVYVSGLTTDDLGAVYVVGGNGNHTKPLVAKLTTAGLPDTSFNQTGKLELDIMGLNGQAQDIHMTQTGDFYVIGSIYQSGSNSDFFVARINADGSYDTSFNMTGHLIIPFDLSPEQPDVALASHLSDSGGVFVTGIVNSGDNGTDFDVGLAKVESDGSLSTDFGTDGQVVLAVHSGVLASDWAFGIDIQDDGKIIVCGFSGPNHNDILPTYIRFNPNGSLDESFGDSGIHLLPPYPNADDSVSSKVTDCQLDEHSRLMSSTYLIDDDGTEMGISRIHLGLDIIYKHGFETED